MPDGRDLDIEKAHQCFAENPNMLIEAAREEAKVQHKHLMEVFYKQGIEVSKSIQEFELTSSDVIELLNVDETGQPHGISDAVIKAYYIGVAVGSEFSM